jgi:hypothetical protein
MRIGNTNTVSTSQFLPGMGAYQGAGAITTTFAFSDIAAGGQLQTYFNLQGYSL